MTRPMDPRYGHAGMTAVKGIRLLYYASLDPSANVRHARVYLAGIQEQIERFL
jgi:hypothetical protein